MAFQQFIRDAEGWRTHATDIHYANAHVEVHRVTVTSPTRAKPFPWTVCHRKAGVVIAPMTSTREFVLVREERVPIRATIWAFPAGQIDDSEEPDAIRATGLRELREEAGCVLAPGGEVVPLGLFFPSPGFTDEHSHLLLARSVVPSPDGAQPDANEGILGTRIVMPDELRAMIASGEIADANTLTAFARLTAMGLL
jgi:ADP-ribose pyrophosphatase